jgi:hypothetical protein
MAKSRGNGEICAFAFASALAAGAQAQTPPPATVPPPPPMPTSAPDFAGDPELEPQVTIIRRENETREEVRVNGQLRYVKVTPRFGLPYYLVPSGNGQTFLRYDSLDTGLRPPMWLLFSW